MADRHLTLHHFTRHAPHYQSTLTYRGSYLMFLRDVERRLGWKIMPGPDADLLVTFFLEGLPVELAAALIRQ
jgi:hypothetical protein